MKIINNDIKELEAHILQLSDTKGIFSLKEDIVNNATTFLNSKYNTIIDEVYIERYVNYLNELSEEDLLELLLFTKKLYINKFGDKYGSIAFGNFFGGLIEDGENYSKLINNSIKINKILFKEFNKIIKLYPKNHKYKVGKYIGIIAKNLNIDFIYNKNIDIYEFWEKYNG